MHKENVDNGMLFNAQKHAATVKPPWLDDATGAGQFQRTSPRLGGRWTRLLPLSFTFQCPIPKLLLTKHSPL